MRTLQPSSSSRIRVRGRHLAGRSKSRLETWWSFSTPMTCLFRTWLIARFRHSPRYHERRECSGAFGLSTRMGSRQAQPSPPMRWAMPDGDLSKHVVERRTYVWPPTSGNAYPRWAPRVLLPLAAPATRWIDLFLADTTVLVGPVVSLSQPGAWLPLATAPTTQAPAITFRSIATTSATSSSATRTSAEWPKPRGSGVSLRRLPAAKDWAFASYRLASLKLDRPGHPIADDRIPHRRVSRCHRCHQPTTLRVVGAAEGGPPGSWCSLLPIRARRPVPRENGVTQQPPKSYTDRGRGPWRRSVTEPGKWERPAERGFGEGCSHQDLDPPAGSARGRAAGLRGCAPGSGARPVRCPRPPASDARYRAGRRPAQAEQQRERAQPTMARWRRKVPAQGNGR
jgi:hypothetical protein